MGSLERRNPILFLLTAGILLSRPGMAEDNSRYLLSIRAGLLTFVEGRPTVTRPATKHYDLKMLEPGNRLLTHHGDKVEISLGPGNYLRVGEDTKVEALQTAYDRMQFLIESGTVILQAPHVNSKSLFVEVSTPRGDLIIAKGGRWRLEVSPSGEVTVLAFKGILEWSREERIITALRPGNRYSLGSPTPGELLQAKLEHRRKDFLDRWSDRRSEILLMLEQRLSPDLRTFQGSNPHP